MKHLDLKGKTCPVPVIETKRFLEGNPVKEIEITVDDATASENVRRFLASRGFATTVAKEGDVYRIEGSLDADSPEVDRLCSPQRPLVFIDGETLGRGSDELGRVLMRSFLNTLKELEVRPWRLIFINGGVKLVTVDSEYRDILKDIEALGVDIIACGTCLDYFHLKERVGVGRVSNMFEIVTSFTDATTVVRP